jgi:predicted membrane-bound spermidine synthase/Flp pilus assembly protein TadD
VPRHAVLYLLFFCSGLSGLIYQVVWVRVFGNVFGNTIHSASLVVAVFMLGLGVGSYVVGIWADRRYATRPESLLRSYGCVELVIALLGLGLSMVLPQLGVVSALASSYTRDASGWYILSTLSYLAQLGIAVVLITPITLLMGGTLTLLIRHLVRSDVASGGWRIARLYGINTAGAAVGCFLTDFALVPTSGLLATQLVAAGFNSVAGLGALWMARTRAAHPGTAERSWKRSSVLSVYVDKDAGAVISTSLALALVGFAAMGVEILWVRHFTILLGGFRAVFSLLLTIILIGVGVGSLLSGFLQRRTARPAQWLMAVQGCFVVSMLVGMSAADAIAVDAETAGVASQVMFGRSVDAMLGIESGMGRTLAELWFNAAPILAEVAVPALLMGFSFPLANAIIQRAEPSVGRRAGVLYLANTGGAVCGSLAAGFLLLPRLGIQSSATALAIVAGLAIVPLYLAAKPSDLTARVARATCAGALLVAGAAVGLWWLLPPEYVITRALPRQTETERVLTVSEGLTEVIAVTEEPGVGRQLLTNGHPMSSTRPLAQRYMRALAHIPLLSMDNPEVVLVIGFGVGNTTHAATLHPSVRRIEVADLSRDILAHAGYFADVNGKVLNDPQVIVYVNDGRHHLHLQPDASYDLITLEPPPIGYAGVGALYSQEFYAIARTRLRPKGYISQWLPAYQVPTATTLGMVRAFVDVFPQAVLISGAGADLLLIGAKDSRVEIDPARVATSLSRAPAAQEDLRRLQLDGVREIVGTFVGSAGTLIAATRDVPAASDDRPLQEYGVQSLRNFGEAVPGSIVDLSQVAAWCPNCFAGGKPIPLAEGLDTYLALLDRAYSASPVEVARTRRLSERQTRVVAGSTYLGALVPESADLHNVIGIDFANRDRIDDAIGEFREALRLEPDSAQTYWHLGAALAAQGARTEAIEHLRRAVQLDPANGRARYDLASLLLESRLLDGAVAEFRAALRLLPNSPEAHNRLGVALAVQGNLGEAIEQFQRALALDAEFADARRNLARAQQQRRQIAERRAP